VNRGEPARANLAHLWKARVENIKFRLDFAAHHLKEVEDDRRSGKIPATDPDAHENAVRSYIEALGRYMNISMIYRDLLLHGRVPDESNHRNRDS
jgi:hypothetical protein